MFSQSGKGSEAPTQPIRETRTAPRSSGETSVISADLKVIGDLVCDGDIQIKGIVEGNIKSLSVTIGEGARVKGAISAETVHISGAIKGQVEAPTVTVAKTAKVNGDIIHQTLSIEAGAHMEGNCRRLETKQEAKKSIDTASLASLKPAASSTAVAETSKKAVGGS
ncbi:MAG: bactofilin family protein [Alphaproteobacteria bacterium]